MPTNCSTDRVAVHGYEMMAAPTRSMPSPNLLGVAEDAKALTDVKGLDVGTTDQI